MARTVKLAPTEKSAPKAKQVVAPSRFSGIRVERVKVGVYLLSGLAAGVPPFPPDVEKCRTEWPTG
jgi:hypothetical protein